MDTTSSLNGSTVDLNTLQGKKHVLQTLLRNATATVTFTKKDGTERVMKCTLKEDIAVPHEKKTDRVKEPKDEILPVWDIEAEAWRSVTIPNIIKVEIN